ncbi:type II secretion system protein GspM [Sphingomonas lenta]|uniref:General secretion pathway protein GspM n=1 Tax=Sphingomonas lenta TaxID=1141887 RepID=A0A2A2SKD3_9SPHN|nr:type II secretion system protein GspM [Sphingomonas lenta]PAX09678.1 general secretion pathway protein GspM [Sphingomonas lenta]
MSARTWFEARSVRERRLLLVMFALLAVTIVWGGIIRPLNDALASARTRHADAVIRLGETQARVDAVRLVQRGGPVTLPLPLADEIRVRASEGGFTLAAVEPDGADRVRVSIQSARPGALTGWLARQEARGLIVDSAALTPGPDGNFGAQLTIRSRAQ